jgi:hypothetical protein
MKFWLKHLFVGAFLLAIALLLLNNQQWVYEQLQYVVADDNNSDDSAIDSEALEQELKETAEQVKKKLTTEPVNKAAEGLSNFYAKINPDYGGKGPRVINNIVYLDDPSINIDKYLRDRKRVVTSISEHWQGARDNRPFRAGETVYQKLLEYTTEQGVELIWYLNRDFVIKSPFRIDKTITRTAYQVGNSISGHFPMGVTVFFCHDHRAIVLIEEPSSYLYEECKELKSTRADEQW